jgi:predicted O-methyltransferase YrrM
MQLAPLTIRQRILNQPLAGQLYLTLKFGPELRRIWPFFPIDGWLDPREAVLLYQLGRQTPDRDGVVVEIGSWLGKSSVVLAKSLVDKRGSRLHCIDPFDASGDDFSQPQYAEAANNASRNLEERFMENIRRAKIDHLIICHRGFSHDVVKNWQLPIDLLFVDGNHDYLAVKDDLLSWLPHVKPGGFVALHDVEFDSEGNPAGKQTGPARAVKEVLQSSKEWADFRQVCSIFAARKLAAD